jgi:hypothetical protein
MLITKASGETEEFSREKLQYSLARTGASEETIDLILAAIEPQIKHGVTSQALHRLAFNLLKKHNRPVAAKYSVKRAIMDLGPTGYPFERLVGAILKRRSFDVEIGVTVQGACVQHEIDALARSRSHPPRAKNKQRFIFAECKFHNKQGRRTEIKTALYVYARFLDVAEGFRAREQRDENNAYEQWLVSNTRFTGDAVTFAACKGMTLLGWDYPARDGLEKIIERERLYPLTCLTSLTFAQKRGLLNNDIVLSSELYDNLGLLRHSLSKGQEKRIRQEIESLFA